MSNAELQERVDYLEGEVKALESALKAAEERLAKSASSYKSKLKDQSKKFDADRLKLLEAATEGADVLTEQAKALLVRAKQDERNPNLGITAVASARSRIELITELFDVV